MLIPFILPQTEQNNSGLAHLPPPPELAVHERSTVPKFLARTTTMLASVAQGVHFVDVSLPTDFLASNEVLLSDHSRFGRRGACVSP